MRCAVSPSCSDESLQQPKHGSFADCCVRVTVRWSDSGCIRQAIGCDSLGYEVQIARRLGAVAPAMRCNLSGAQCNGFFAVAGSAGQPGRLLVRPVRCGGPMRAIHVTRWQMPIRGCAILGSSRPVGGSQVCDSQHAGARSFSMRYDAAAEEYDAQLTRGA